MSKSRPKTKLVRFGQYLQDLRITRKKGSQRKVATALKSQGHQVTQGAIAQYEGGLVTNPHYELLSALARLYDEPYENMIVQLVADKYKVKPPPEQLSGSSLPVRPAIRLEFRDIDSLREAGEWFFNKMRQ
ncbi:MAG: helix-turn-helix domain-containing protein [Candidatus Andersenbacteria bacterium]|nr:helix-turn-helix domain-containing protein [Candidatus Andersenbacteria bacterium]